MEITDWLDKHGNPEIYKKVEDYIEKTNMEDEYVIINKTAIQKRIEELESKIIPNPNFDSEIDSHNLLFIAKQNELNKILSQSTPLIPEIENAFDAGQEYGTNMALFYNTDKVSRVEFESTFDKEEYISNLKLNI